MFLCLLKFGFSEKATKFERIFVIKERCVLCAQQHTCQKVNEDYSKKCGQVVLYNLYLENSEQGENCLKINKRTCQFIRYLRVCSTTNSLLQPQIHRMFFLGHSAHRSPTYLFHNGVKTFFKVQNDCSFWAKLQFSALIKFRLEKLKNTK